MSLGLSQQLVRLLRRDRRKILQKVGQRVPAIKIVEKRLYRHASSGEAWCAAHDLGIDGDDARLHDVTLVRRFPLARFVCVAPRASSPASDGGSAPASPRCQNAERSGAAAKQRTENPCVLGSIPTGPTQTGSAGA